MVTAHSEVSAPVASPEILKKVQALASKAPYEAPRVVSYPLDGLKPLDQMASTGNF